MTQVKDEILLRIDADIKGLISKIAAGREELTKFKDRQKEIQEQMKVLTGLGQSSGKMYQDLAKELILVNGQIDSSTKSVKSYQSALERTITAQNTSEGSLAQLKAQLSASTNAWDKLSEAERENSDEGKALQKSIADINAKLVEQEGITGRNQRNVGNYKSALDGVKEKLFELSNLKAEINAQGFAAAKDALDGVKQSVNDLAKKSQEDFAKVQKSLVDTGKSAIEQASSIKELTKIMKAYQDASLIATDDVKIQFTALAAEAQDKLGDIKQEIKNLASDTSAFDAVSQGVNVVVSSYGAFQAASSFFGKENENVQEALQKTGNALLLVNSISQITNALQKESSLVVKGTAAAQSIWNFSLLASDRIMKALRISTVASTVAANGFRVALAASGIGLIVIGLGLLIANFDKVVDAVKTVTGSLTGLGGRFNVIGSILRPFIAIVEGVFVGLKKLGQLIGVVDSDEEARLKNNIDLQEKQMTQINEKYDLESRLLKASGQDTKKVEDDKLKAQNENIKGQIENLFRLQQANGELTEDQLTKLDELKAAWKKNFEDILVSQTEYNAKQKDLSTQAELQLLNIEQRKQQALGQDTTAKKLQIAEREYQIAVDTAKKKGEDTTVIEADYEQQIFDIKKEASDKRKDLDFKIRESQIALIKDSREKEIEQERLSLDQKLSSIVGFGTRENTLRTLARQQSADNINAINKKFADQELQEMIQQQQKKLQLSSEAQLAIDNAEIANATTRAGLFAAQLKLVNDSTASQLDQKKLDKQKELDIEDAATAALIERLRATAEFKNATIQDQQDQEFQIIQTGITNKEDIQKKYDADQLALLGEQANQIKELTLEYNAELNQQAQDDNALRLELERGNFDVELELQIEQSLLQEAAEINAKERTEAQKSLIHRKYAEQRKELTKQNELAQLAIISGVLGQASALFKKGSQEYKSLAIAQAIIDTYRAAAAALSPPPTGAGPIFGPIVAGITIATGLANIAKIKETDPGFKDGGLFDGAGFTGDGHPSQESNAVGAKPYKYHRREYIISDPMMKDPVVSNFVRTIAEPLRRNKLRGSFSSSSFAGGGYASTMTSGGSTIIQSISKEDIQEAFEIAVSKLPPPVTVIQDVTEAAQRVSTIEDRANL